MNIALVGYGKMGKAIEAIAVERGHNIVLKITSANKSDLTLLKSNHVDVAIEFTNPDVAPENVLQCLNAGVSTVCGSTGWYNQLDEVLKVNAASNTALLYASNFSVGVNIFFEVNKYLAKLMNTQPDYNVAMEETHHTQKKDAPSGTAITLAEQILEQLKRKDNWVLGSTQQKNELGIEAHRIENVPGTHVVTYSSEIDEIEIRHTAHNRKGFAMGAVLAAEYIHGKSGVFSMKDVLGI